MFDFLEIICKEARGNWWLLISSIYCFTGQFVQYSGLVNTLQIEHFFLGGKEHPHYIPSCFHTVKLQTRFELVYKESNYKLYL